MKEYNYFIKCRVRIYVEHILKHNYVVNSMLEYPNSVIIALQKAQNKIIRSVDVEMYHYIIPFLYEICELESSEIVSFEFVIYKEKKDNDSEIN
jgi:hypothetical protein